jgi:hypothetical protein
MKKRIPRKLVLRYETLRALTRIELTIAVGGGGPTDNDTNCPALPAVATGANPGG